MPSKPSYGSTVKARALRLFKALLLFAKGELDNCFNLDITCRWDEKAGNKLVVQTKLRVLEVLVSRDGEAGTLTNPQMRESLHRMQDFLHILEDNRPIKQGKEEWHFTLKLWLSDIAANIQKFDQTWESLRPEHSKSQERARVTAAPPVPPRRRPTGGVPFQVPPLPAHFVERPEVSDALKASLFSAETSQTGVLVVSAIYGLGGIGKSTLAAALAGNEEVYGRFPDGVLWATLGQQPDLLSILSAWIRALRDYNFKPTTLEAAKRYLQTLLADKAALLVMDDVWNAEHFEFFRVGSGDCRLLATTREASIRDANRYELDVMAPTQALELLRRYPGVAIAAADEAVAGTLAETADYLPLALELVAAQVADGVSWQELLADLTREIALLEALDSPRGDTARKNYSLQACFNLSLRRLSPLQLQQFAWLGVLPEDVSLTPALATTLWELEEPLARQVLREFQAKGLLLSGTSLADGTQTYHLHDLLHDMACRLLTGRVAPENEGLPGLGLTLPQAHARLLERYRAKTQQGLWQTLADDGYIHAHLSWHLVKADRVEELHQLLEEETEAGRNGWYEACDALGKLAVFVRDVARAWERAEEAFEASPSCSIALQCRYALITSSLNSWADHINSLVGHIPAKLMAALVENGVWTPVQGLAYARQVKDSSKRAESLVALAPYLPNVLLPEALETVQGIQHGSCRAYALSGLAPHLPETLLPEALETAKGIQHGGCRASALSGLAPHLPETLLPEALEIAKGIEVLNCRASALSGLAPHLPETLLPEALETAKGLKNEYFRAYVLSALAPRLPEILPEALETAKGLKLESWRASALSSLAPHLPETLLPEALEVAKEIETEPDRAYALRSLAPQLPEILPEALESAKGIESESDRAIALSVLAPQLPEALLPEALETAKGIESEWGRGQALSALAPRLPEALLPEALETTKGIKLESWRVRVLSALAPQLPEALLLAFLDAVREIEEPYRRAEAFRGIAQTLKRFPTNVSLWQELLHELACRDLHHFLADLAELVPVTIALGGSESLPEIARAIQDVGRQWP